MTMIESQGAVPTTRSFWLGVAAYLVPTFPIAYAWHLVGLSAAASEPRRRDLEAWADLWGRARNPVVVVHDSGGGGQEHHGFGAGLHRAGDRLHAAAVRHCWPPDRAGLPGLIVGPAGRNQS